jgi:hypothetical protein
LKNAGLLKDLYPNIKQIKWINTYKESNPIEPNNFYKDDSLTNPDGTSYPHLDFSEYSEFMTYQDPYYFDGSALLPSVSIALGVGIFAYKLNMTGNGVIKDGVYNYNGGGDSKYITKFRGSLTTLLYSEKEINTLMDYSSK